MPVLAKVKSWWRAKDSPSPPIINDGDRNLPSITVYRAAGGGRYYPYSGDSRRSSATTGYDYIRRAESGYKRNSDVYACVSLIGYAGKQVKWWDGSGASKTAAEWLMKSIRIASKYTEPAEPSHRKYWLTKISKPNPKASIAMLEQAGGAAFIEQWLSYLLLAGNCFIELERTGRTSGAIKQLHLLQPDYVSPNIDQDAVYAETAITHWKVSTRKAGIPRQVPLENMVHSKLFNPTDDLMGMSPLQAALLRVEMQNAGMAHVRRTLERGVAPGWIELHKDSDWDDEQVISLRNNVAASRSEGDELVLQNATFHDSGIKPSDSGLSQGHLLTKRDICSVFHVDPALVGDTDGRTFATYRESRRALYSESVIPLLTQFRDDWNDTIGYELESPLDFDKDSFDAIAAARDEAADRVRGLFQSGLIDRNESRRDLEYDPVPGSDGVFYAPASFVPMDGEDEPKPKPAGKPEPVPAQRKPA